jgi:Ca2+/Na+ antiporter
MASLAFLTKYPLGIMLPIIGLIYLALEKKDSPLKKARNLFLGAITFILPVLAWVKYITLDEIIRGLNFVSVESGFFFYLQNVLIIIGATIVLLPFIKNYKVEKKDLLFIIPALLIFIVFQTIKHKEARYLIPALPFLSIFLAKISDKIKHFIPIIIVCFALSTIALMALNALTCDDSKGFAQIRDFINEEGGGMTMSNFWPIYAYYSNGPVWHICEPCEFEQDIISQNAEYIAIFSYSPCAKTDYSKYELIKTIDKGCGTISIYKI